MPISKIASYNIKSGQGMDGKVDLNRTADVLAGLNADFIALQEVDVNKPRSFSVHQAEYLAKRLGMDYVFGAAIVYKNDSFYGNAILSRFPIITSSNHQLPAQDPKRAMMKIEADVNGNKLRLFNTHLELNRQLRLQQMQDFIVPFIQSDNVATIFCGDLNESPHEAAVSYFSNHMQDSFSVNRKAISNTFPADYPVERMDYIFYNQACAAVDYEIISSLASDHLPILATIHY